MIKLEDSSVNIYGKSVFRDDIWNRILDVMNDVCNEAGSNEFVGKRDRLNFASYSSLITYNNDDVGFIYFANEERYSYALFIDMVIKKKYRNRGIGGFVLDEINKMYNGKEFLIGEVKTDNILSNSISKKYGELIHQNGFNYYLIQKDRLDEFNAFNSDHLFEKSMGRQTLDSHALVRKIYNDR